MWKWIAGVALLGMYALSAYGFTLWANAVVWGTALEMLRQ